MELFTALLQDIEHTPHAIVFGVGDYIDWTRTTHRAPIRAIGATDDKFLEELDAMVMRTLIEPFVWKVRRKCPSFARKCAGLVEGNHYHQFRNGTTSTQKICELLGVQYLGLAAWVRIACARSRSSNRTKLGTVHNLNIVLNHSVSCSGSLGPSLAQANKKAAAFRDVDVFLTGNDHQLGHEVIQQLGCTRRGEPRMLQTEVVIGKCGSMQKGYEEGATSSSYVEKKLLRPSHLGYLAFDAWVHYSGNAATNATRKNTPEVWRFGNFSA